MKERNPITGKLEPAFPVSVRYMRMVGAFSTMLFMICLVIISIAGVIIYRTFVSIQFIQMKEFK